MEREIRSQNAAIAADCSQHQATMTHYQRQGKVRVTHGQWSRDHYNQSYDVLLSCKLNRDSLQRSTGDVQLTKWLDNCFLQQDSELTEQLTLG